MASSAALYILTIIFSLAATILAFIFIVPEKKRAKLNKFGKLLHDTFNFKFLIIEKILQFCYILATATTIIGGFFTLFSFEKHYRRSGTYTSEWVGYWGLLIMILGPIAVRLAYELIIMAVLAVKNIIQINNKLKNQNGDDAGDVFSANNFKEYIASVPAQQPVASQPVVNSPKFCTKCGALLNADGSCPNCVTETV